MTETSCNQLAIRRPLPVTIVSGMKVYDVSDISGGKVVGITQQYCIYRRAESGNLCVANWREVALGNICPADPLLPGDVTVNDRLNASATVLRELLELQHLAGGLTAAQQAVLDELVADLVR